MGPKERAWADRHFKLAHIHLRELVVNTPTEGT